MHGSESGKKIGESQLRGRIPERPIAAAVVRPAGASTYRNDSRTRLCARSLAASRDGKYQGSGRTDQADDRAGFRCGPDVVVAYEYLQPCGHRLSGDRPVSGALVSKG
jgi:hypothetical protein